MNPLAHTPRCEKYNKEQSDEPFCCICMLHSEDCDLRKHDKIFTCTCKPSYRFHPRCTAHDPNKAHSLQDQCYCRSLFRDSLWEDHRAEAKELEADDAGQARIMHALCDLREELDELRGKVGR